MIVPDVPVVIGATAETYALAISWKRTPSDMCSVCGGGGCGSRHSGRRTDRLCRIISAYAVPVPDADLVSVIRIRRQSRDRSGIGLYIMNCTKYYVSFNNLTYSPNETTITFRSLPANHSYTYQIKAANSTESGAYSAVRTVTTVPLAPAASGVSGVTSAQHPRPSSRSDNCKWSLP